jgi:hypothetical protein
LLIDVKKKQKNLVLGQPQFFREAGELARRPAGKRAGYTGIRYQKFSRELSPPAESVTC